jgi:hypothetical protein
MRKSSPESAEASSLVGNISVLRLEPKPRASDGEGFCKMPILDTRSVSPATEVSERSTSDAGV